MTLPVVTVVIPTRDRLECLRLALDALAVQTVPPGDFEVVVADDGSTDGTPRFSRRPRSTRLPSVGRALRAAGPPRRAIGRSARRGLRGSC